jgi:hypothetical protein
MYKAGSGDKVLSVSVGERRAHPALHGPDSHPDSEVPAVPT